jgi:amino acid transporter
MDDRSSPSTSEVTLGEGSLSTIHAVGQSLAVGPIFSVGLLSGLVAGFAGVSTPASVLLATIGALALAYLVSLYARRFAGAGAIYEYLFHTGGSVVGVFSGGLYFIGMLLIQGSFAIGWGFLANGFWAEHISSGAPAFWVFGVIYLAVIALMNYFGVKLAVRGVLVLAAVSCIPLLLLAIVIIAKGGAEGQSLSAFSPFAGDGSGILNGVLFAVTLFIGFEAAASIAEETKEPRRSIPLAVISTVTIVAVFYLLMTYAMSIGFGAEGIEGWAGSPSPLGELAETYVGNWLATIIGLVILFDMLSAGLAFSVTGCRGLFALARDGFLPRPLASTSRWGTPVGGVVAMSVVGVAVLIWGATSSLGDKVELPNSYQAFTVLVGAGSFIVEGIYVLLALAGLRLVYQLGNGVRDWWRYIIVLIALALPLLAFKGALDPWPKSPEIGIYIAFGALALAVAWVIALLLTRPEVIKGAAQHAIAEHEMTMGPESVEQLTQPSLRG